MKGCSVNVGRGQKRSGPPRTVDSGRRYGVWLLSRREYSRFQIAQKLRQKEYPDDVAMAVLDWLEEMGLQSDRRFMEMDVRRRLASGKGPAYVRRALSVAGISGMDEEISMAIEGALPDPVLRATEILARKFRSFSGDRKDRDRAYRFLASRGFSMDVIGDAVRAFVAQSAPLSEGEEGP